ncbi:RnfABCDGE type electron transport complex subunit B [Hydrocarboniphaga sp.]|uniref:RnfABCDGE type electron transport complex subunit B n=1 Tax=Hydrocarboniphaga sp. TaxID=2033016 RepID=UPI003D0ECD2C
MDAERIDALLPQTQCTRCGYPACRPYAEAIAEGSAALNRCPPGGEATIAALAQLLRREPLPLDADCGTELPVATVARVIEADCIGCTKCIQACPVDAIVGAANLMHVVITAECTGCELCLPPCPVDCIVMESAPQLPLPRLRADEHRQRYVAREARLERWETEERERRRRNVASDPLAAALARSRAALP